MVEDGKVVKCPICNKVLYIKDKDTQGTIEIRCLRCKNISKIDLKEKES